MRKYLQSPGNVYPPGRGTSIRPAAARHVDAQSHLCERIYNFQSGVSLCDPCKTFVPAAVSPGEHGASGLHAKWQWSLKGLGSAEMFRMAEPRPFWSTTIRRPTFSTHKSTLGSASPSARKASNLWTRAPGLRISYQDCQSLGVETFQSLARAKDPPQSRHEHPTASRS
jgi:hypothetical protein